MFSKRVPTELELEGLYAKIYLGYLVKNWKGEMEILGDHCKFAGHDDPFAENKRTFKDGIFHIIENHVTVYTTQRTVEMDFGLAVKNMKLGKKVARRGWNGADMFAYYVPANKYPVSRNMGSAVEGMFVGDMVPYRAYLALKTAQNDIAAWSPSTSDALAEDWFIYGE